MALVRQVEFSVFSVFTHAVKFVPRSLLHSPIVWTRLVVLIKIATATVVTLDMEVCELKRAILVLVHGLVAVALWTALQARLIVRLVVAPLALSVEIVLYSIEVLALVVSMAAISLMVP